MNVLMLGGPNTGKSTFLVQLYGRMMAGRGQLVARGTPADLKPISDALKRLASGLALEHTRPSDKQMVQHLLASTADGHHVDLDIPEYAGETLQDLVRSHRIPDLWRTEIPKAAQWLLFVRLEQFPDLPELLGPPVTHVATDSAGLNGPAEDSANPNGFTGKGGGSGASIPTHMDLPLDMRLVELLQMLLHERAARPRGAVSHPFLTVLLSCWDELNLDEGTRPYEVAAQRIPLLHSYTRSIWRPEAIEYLGLSSQGRELLIDTPDEEYVDLGPDRHGFVITAEGEPDPDLTRVVRLP